MKLEKLFFPIKIAGCEVKNRIVMSPMGGHFENMDGSISESLIDYFETRAKGGIGLIISPHTLVNKEEGKGGLYIFSDRFIPGMNRLCDRVQSFGTKFFLQLGHRGGRVKREFIQDPLK